MRPDRQREAGAGFVPNAIVITGADTKGVIAGRTQIVSSHARCLRLPPGRVQSLELPLKAYLGRGHQAGGRIMKLKDVPARAEGQDGCSGRDARALAGVARKFAWL